MQMSLLYDQVYDSCQLSLQTFPPKVLHPQLLKWSFIPILEEKSQIYMLFQQDVAPPISTRKWWTSQIIRFQTNGLPGAEPSLGNVIYLTLLWFFLLGYIKDVVYVPPMVTTLVELAGRITEAVVTFTPDVLDNVWTKTEYTLICWATHSALT